MQQRERDGENVSQMWGNYGKDKRHKTGLHSAEEIEELIIFHKRKHNKMAPTSHGAY